VTDFRTGISLRCGEEKWVEQEEDENDDDGDDDDDDNLCLIFPRNILCQIFESLQICLWT
jgi:hypothetical protein